MKNFKRVMINRLDPEKFAQKIAEKLEKARSIGAANEFDEVLTGISQRTDHYSDDRISFNTHVALFPKQSLIDCELFQDHELQDNGSNVLFSEAYLSELAHVLTGKNSENPEKVLVQVRTKKMFQGHEQVSVSHAGYCTYGEHPAETAVREFKEELKKFKDIEPRFLENDNGVWKEAEFDPDDKKHPPCLDCTMHYMPPDRKSNPVPGFVQYVEPRTAGRYPTVNTLEELNALCKDTGDFEVLGIAWIPTNNLRDFWTDVTKADRVYSISRETSENLMHYLDIQ